MCGCWPSCLVCARRDIRSLAGLLSIGSELGVGDWSVLEMWDVYMFSFGRLMVVDW